jgi:hypothetical protein
MNRDLAVLEECPFRFYEGLGAMTEYQGLRNLSEAAIKAEAAEKLFEEACQRVAEHQAATGHR